MVTRGNRHESSSRIADVAPSLLVFLSLVAFSPVVNFQSWTPKAALMPFFAAAGLPNIGAAWRERRAEALAGGAFLVIAALSTLTSVNRTTATFGLYGWGTGWLFVAALVGGWLVGLGTNTAGRRWLQAAVVAATVVNVGAAVLELFFDLSTPGLGIVAGRPPGLLGNPINLAALCAGCFALLALAVPSERRWPWVLLVAVAGLGLQLGAGRLLVLFAIAVVVWTGLRGQWAVAGLLAVGLAAGIVAGSALAHTHHAVGGTDRLTGAAATSGIRSRVEIWSSARKAVLRRPVLGTGPGTFAAATSQDRTLTLARSEAPDTIFADAHNFVVEYLVTTGILGLLALGLWLLLLFRSARGPLLGFAIGLFVAGLVQPQHVAIGPVAFLALGTADRRGCLEGRRGRLVAASRFTLMTAALVAAAVLCFADFELHESSLDFTISQARAAERVLPHWKDPASLLSRNYTYLSITSHDPALLRVARAWRLEAVEREPTDAGAWTKLAEIDVRLREYRNAEADLRQALRWNPQSVIARLGLAQALAFQHRFPEALAVLSEAERRPMDGDQQLEARDLRVQITRARGP